MRAAGLVRGRLRLWRNALRARPGRGAAATRHPLLVLAMVALMAVLVERATFALFAALNAAWAGPESLAATLGVALGMAVAGVLVFDLDTTVATLLLDPDLDLLRRSPSPPVAVFALKLADAAPRTLIPLLVLALPAMLSWARVVGFSGRAWLALPALLAALWVVPLGFGLAVTLPALRLVPARRARQVLALLSTLTLTAMWLLNVLWVPRLAEEGGAPLERARLALEAAARNPLFAPGRWAAQTLEALRHHDPAQAVHAALPLAALAIAAAALAALSAARHLGAALETTATRGALRSARPPAGRFAGARPLPLAAAVLAREARMFRREWTVAADVLTAAALWTLLPLASLALFQASGAPVVRAMLAMLAIGLGYEIGTRCIPFERRALAWTALAPVPRARWLAAKWLAAAALAAPVLVGISIVLALAAGRRSAGWGLDLGYGLVALVLSLSLGLWTGARFPDLGWTSPRAMLTLGGRLVASTLIVAQAALWIGVITGLEAVPGAPSAPVALGIAIPVAASISILVMWDTRAVLLSRDWYS